MSDWNEDGAGPVDDAAVDDPPTVSEVQERQRERYPEQVPEDTEDTEEPDGEPPAVHDDGDR